MTTREPWSWPNLGTWLKNQRLAVGIPREKMAQACACSVYQISKNESGKNRIPLDRLVIWCRLTMANVQDAIKAAQQEEK